MAPMTPEERIKAAAEVLRTDGSLVTNEEAVRLVAPILNPEDFPPKPKWPSDESLKAFQGYGSCCMVPPAHDGPITGRLETAVKAALLADPIIKAAVEWHHYSSAENKVRLERAIDEAGL